MSLLCCNLISLSFIFSCEKQREKMKNLKPKKKQKTSTQVKRKT